MYFTKSLSGDNLKGMDSSIIICRQFCGYKKDATSFRYVSLFPRYSTEKKILYFLQRVISPPKTAL